jgi:adenylate cyclase, class 2
MLEVELKFAVPDLNAVRSHLHRLQAHRVGAETEHDLYYNSPIRDFAETDEALRVRYAGPECTVTYKGPKINIHGAKAREEFNVTVDSGPAFEQILSRSGFSCSAEVNKRREIYTLAEATVTLDDVEGLGTFIEIEVLTENDGAYAAEKVNTLAKELGVEGEPLFTSYLELLASKP